MPFISSRRVEFCDTDMAGIVHFSAFFRYMEAAEHAWLRALGMSVVHAEEEGHMSWPRVSASCDFRVPVRFEDVLHIEVRIDRLGTKSVTYGFAFAHDEKTVATGKMTSVCCRVRPGLAPQAIAIPDWIVAKLEEAC